MRDVGCINEIGTVIECERVATVFVVGASGERRQQLCSKNEMTHCFIVFCMAGQRSHSSSDGRVAFMAPTTTTV